MADPRLGRLYSPDERDRRFPMRAAIRHDMPLPPFHIWTPGPVLDQGETPMCVGHAWQGWRLALPMNEKPADPTIPDSIAESIYHAAQAIDEWAGSPHDGTSVRAAARVLASPTGVLSLAGKAPVTQYVWAQHWTDIRDYVLLHGPVVMGTTWYAAMFTPRQGWLKLDGSPEGGHAWMIHGYADSIAEALRAGLNPALAPGNADQPGFLMRNSWNETWGLKGGAWLSPQDLESLLTDQGEACSAVGDPNVDPTSGTVVQQ